MESTEHIDFHSSSEEEMVPVGDVPPDLEEIIMYCRVNQKKIQKKTTKKGQLQPAPLPPDTKEAAEHL